MHMDDDHWATYYGRKNEPGEKRDNTDEKELTNNLNRSGTGELPHILNFIQAVRSRKPGDLNSDVLEGHLSATLCHLCNIAYRTRRQVIFVSSVTDGSAKMNSVWRKLKWRESFLLIANVEE